jgi:hypothetical protein
VAVDTKHTDPARADARYQLEMSCGECHTAVGNRSDGARKRSCKAVSRSSSSIGPLHRGHDQVAPV